LNSTDDTPTKRLPRIVYIVLGLILGGLGLYFSLRDVQWPAVLEALTKVRWAWLILAVSSSIGVAVLKATRWYRLFAPDHRHLDWRSVLATLLLAQTVNVIVPVRGVGEALRIGVLTGRFSVSALRVSGTIVLEKFLDMLSLALLALVVTPITVRVLDRPILSKAFLLLIGTVCLGIVLTVRFQRVIKQWLTRWPIAERLLDQVLQGFNALQSSVMVGELGGWTLAVRGLSLVSLFAALRSTRVTVPLLGILALHILLNFSYLLPTPPGMIGLVQYVSVLVLGFFGVARPQTLGAGIILHLTILSPHLLLGLPAWAYVWSLAQGEQDSSPASI
jgi:hypothetical protein